MSSELRQQAAEQYDQAAAELEAAVDHLRITAGRFRNDDVPSGCAHVFAAQGQLYKAEELLRQLAILHASKAQR
jgi:hypothetical protein